ncbi:MAG: energy-coupling factor ABC transporter ATP-binding protein [Methanoregula sp.]
MITVEALRYRDIVIGALALPPGVTSLIGPNGSGKTTFLKLCAGITAPEHGTVLVDGQCPRLTEIGYVNEFPDRNILFPMVKDELASPLRFAHIPCRETDHTVRDCAARLGLSPLLDRRVQDLSGGEKIMVAFAAACISRPKVLVLDECDSHLDVTRCAWLERMLRDAGAPYMIRCTQQMETAANSDYLLYFEQGRVLYTGTPAEVFTRLHNTSFYPLSWRCPE